MVFIRIYDLSQKKFITIDDNMIVSKNNVSNLTLVLDYTNAYVGNTFILSNFVDMIPNTGYGAGLSKLPNNYYTNDNKVEAYFSDATLVAYNLYNLRIYFNFNVKIIKEINKIPYYIYMTGDSCELIIYKIILNKEIKKIIV